MKLHDEHSIEEMPTFVEDWIDLSGHGSMFSPWIKDRGLNEWEMQYCPWWLDYPIGEYSRYEAHHYKGIIFVDLFLPNSFYHVWKTID